MKNTANSVAKWVWKEYTKRWTNEEFSQIQAERGKRGGKVGGRGGTEADKQKRLQAAQMRTDSYTQQQIADKLSVSKRTIIRWLKS